MTAKKRTSTSTYAADAEGLLREAVVQPIRPSSETRVQIALGFALLAVVEQLRLIREDGLTR